MGGSYAGPAGGLLVGSLPKNRGFSGMPASALEKSPAYSVGGDGILKSGPPQMLLHSGKSREGAMPGKRSRIASRGHAAPDTPFKIHPPLAEPGSIPKAQGKPSPVGLEKSQINTDELLKLAKAILDRDSPHGAGGTQWAEQALQNKIAKLEVRYDRSLLGNGSETGTSLALKAQVEFLNSAYSIIIHHLGKLKPAQEKYAAAFKEAADRWAKRNKIPDFIDSVVAKYVAPGMGILGGAAAKLSTAWDGFMGTLRAWLSPQKQWIATGLEIAAPVMASAADVALVYLSRKWLIGWAANRKAEMEARKQSELLALESERQALLKREYNEVERRILSLLSQASPTN